MDQPRTTTPQPTATAPESAPRRPTRPRVPAPPAPEPATPSVEDLLEDVSIDGMCGVY